MRTTLTILLFLVFANSYSQKLNCETVIGHSASDIYQEFFKYRYSITEAKCFGEKLAKYDKQRGLKRILTLNGPFTTGCLKCIYHKFGFETIELGPDDIFDDNLMQFMDSYNEVMDSILNKEQKKEIDKVLYKSELIFNFSLTFLSKFKVERINDSILHMKMSSDTLEHLFRSDIKYLKIGIGDSPFESNIKILKYVDLKSNGVDIPLKNEIKKELSFCFDFSEMPNRYDLCWCELSQHKYWITKRFKIK